MFSNMANIVQTLQFSRVPKLHRIHWIYWYMAVFLWRSVSVYIKHTDKYWPLLAGGPQQSKLPGLPLPTPRLGSCATLGSGPGKPIFLFQIPPALTRNICNSYHLVALRPIRNIGFTWDLYWYDLLNLFPVKPWASCISFGSVPIVPIPSCFQLPWNRRWPVLLSTS